MTALVLTVATMGRPAWNLHAKARNATAPFMPKFVHIRPQTAADYRPADRRPAVRPDRFNSVEQPEDPDERGSLSLRRSWLSSESRNGEPIDSEPSNSESGEKARQGSSQGGCDVGEGQQEAECFTASANAIREPLVANRRFKHSDALPGAGMQPSRSVSLASRDDRLECPLQCVTGLASIGDGGMRRIAIAAAKVGIMLEKTRELS